MSPGVSHALLTVAVCALIAWRLYARVRRTIGRQRLSTWRPWFTVVVFPLLILMLVFAAHLQPVSEAALLGGVAAGVALGLCGLRLTRFEASAEGLYYTPSAHLGIALSTLLVCRLGYRFIVTGVPGVGAGMHTPTPMTPLTALLIGTLVGYYTAYAAGLLRWSGRTRGPRAAEVSP